MFKYFFREKENKQSEPHEQTPPKVKWFDKHNKVSLYYTENSFDLNADDEKNSITEENRLTSSTSNKGSLFAALGSSFVTNNPNRVQNSRDLSGKILPSHTLDASFAAVLPDGGSILAIADGCGGHQETEQDKAIAYTSHYATKAASQILSRYNSAKELIVDIVEGKVIEELKHLLREKLGKKNERFITAYDEGTTIGCARIFKNNSAEGKQEIKVAGFNIGDSMIVAWVPSTKSFVTLAYARTRILNDRGSEGTAIFPNAYDKEEVMTFCRPLPADAIIMGFTDFIHEHLPSKNETIKMRDHLVHAAILDEDYMVELLSAAPQDATASDFCQVIIRDAFKRADEQVKVLRERSKIAKVNAKEVEAEINQLFQDKTQSAEDIKASTLFRERRALFEALSADAYIQHGDDLGVVGVSLAQDDEHRMGYKN
jgi:hypothetical protein